MSNKYGFNEDQVAKDSLPFPVAENVDNVILEKCSYVHGEKEGEPWEGIRFEYSRQASGDTMRLNDTRFAAVRAKAKATDTKTAEENYEDTVKRKNAQLRHIATKFGITDTELRAIPTDGSFKSTAMGYCELVNSRCRGKKLYCKTVKNGKYVTMATFPPFLQNMAEGECTLAYNDSEKNQMKENAPAGVINDDSVNSIV